MEKGGGRAALAQAAMTTAIVLIAIAIEPIDESDQAIERIALVLSTIAYVLLARILFERRSWIYSRHMPEADVGISARRPRNQLG